MHFIVNRTAGSGKCGECFDLVRKYLDERKINYTFDVTTCRGDEKSLTEKAVSLGNKLIIAAGGDGTVRGVASVLLGTDIVLGILPFGTGNDLVKPLKIPTLPIEAIKNIISGFVKKLDAGRINGKAFFNIAGIGFDVDVLVETERYKSKLGLNGMLPYFLGILSSILGKKKIPMKITLDDETVERDILLIDIANGTYFGGGMLVAPDSDPFDGYFDVVMIKDVGFFRFLALLPKFIKGTHINYRDVVTVKRAKKVSINAMNNEEYPIQMDGEIDDVTPVSVEMIKGAVNIIVPEAADEV